MRSRSLRLSQFVDFRGPAVESASQAGSSARWRGLDAQKEEVMWSSRRLASGSDWMGERLRKPGGSNR
ncbi:MAG: hypothetical protein JOY60_03290 [Burkholderiaceae bacterium]|nr:hypothetical protein [Roseateles sp.]MBV8468873.1 hypothetical protein [Burkholderiaceae bacterium]